MQIRQEEENYTERRDLHGTLRHLSEFHKFYLNFILKKRTGRKNIVFESLCFIKMALLIFT
jgi:hypothetical protein